MGICCCCWLKSIEKRIFCCYCRILEFKRKRGNSRISIVTLRNFFRFPWLNRSHPNWAQSHRRPSGPGEPCTCATFCTFYRATPGGEWTWREYRRRRGSLVVFGRPSYTCNSSPRQRPHRRIPFDRWPRARNCHMDSRTDRTEFQCESWSPGRGRRRWWLAPNWERFECSLQKGKKGRTLSPGAYTWNLNRNVLNLIVMVGSSPFFCLHRDSAPLVATHPST